MGGIGKEGRWVVEGRGERNDEAGKKPWSRLLKKIRKRGFTRAKNGSPTRGAGEE